MSLVKGLNASVDIVDLNRAQSVFQEKVFLK